MGFVDKSVIRWQIDLIQTHLNPFCVVWTWGVLLVALVRFLEIEWVVLNFF